MTRLTVAAVLSLTVLGVPAFAGQATPAPAAQAQAPAAPGTPKLAFINLQRIAGESAEGKIAAAKVQALNQKKVNELTEKNKLLQSNQQKLAGGAVLNDAARAQLEKDIEKLNIELQRFQQDANTEVQELQQELQNEFQEQLMPIVEAVVKEMGIGLLFSVADAGVVYLDPQLDITTDVIKRLDAATASAPKSAAPAKPAAPPATAAPAKPPVPAAPAPKPLQK